MAKFRTLELHLYSMTTIKVGPNKYQHTLTLRDWDDGEEVNVTMTLKHPISAVTPLKLRVIEEDIPEAPPPT